MKFDAAHIRNGQMKLIFPVMSLLILIPAPHAHAASAILQITPATSTIQTNSDITLTIVIDAGSNNITAAQACIMYDADKLIFKETKPSTVLVGAVPPDSSTDCASGEIQIGRFGTPPHPTGTFTLATVRFTATAAVTSSTLQIGSRSFIYDDNTTNIFDHAGSGSALVTTTDQVTAPPAANEAPAPAEPTKLQPVTKPIITPAPETPVAIAAQDQKGEPDRIEKPAPATNSATKQTDTENSVKPIVIGLLVLGATISLCIDGYIITRIKRKLKTKI